MYALLLCPPALIPVISHVTISYWIKPITVASLNFLSLLLYVACRFLYERRLCHRCSVFVFIQIVLCLFMKVF